MLIPNKFNGYSPDGIRQYNFGLGEAALAGSLAAAGAEAGGAAAAGAGALGAAEGIGALGAGLTAADMTALGATGSLIPGLTSAGSLLGPELMATSAINAATPSGIASLGSAIPGMANPLAGLNLTGALQGAVPGGLSTLANAGTTAGSMAGNIAPAVQSGMTLKDVGQAASLASNAYSLGNKLLGGNQAPSYSAPLQAPPVVGASTPMINPLSQSIIAAPTVASAYGDESMYSNFPKHFAGGGDVIGLDDYYGPALPVSANDLSQAYDYGTKGQLGYTSPEDVASGKVSTGSISDILKDKNKETDWLDWLKKRDPKTGEMVYDWGKIGMLGLGGAGIASLFAKPNLVPLYQPKTAQQYGLGSTLSKNYRATRPMAEGGLTAPGILALNNPYSNEPDDGMSDGGVAGGNNMYPMSQQNVSHYAVPSQLPAGAHQVAQQINDADMNRMAAGGISSLGSYSDGGRMLKGPGDGMSDNIPATIAGKQPARLAEGEFVMPADVVSGLGNGSTDAGAKQLYAMMDRVRKARTGTKKQGKQIKPEKYMAA